MGLPFGDDIVGGAIFGVRLFVAPHAAEGVGSVVGNAGSVVDVDDVVCED